MHSPHLADEGGSIDVSNGDSLAGDVYVGLDSAELERLSGSSTIYHAVADAADGAMGQLVAPLRGGSSSLCGMLMTLARPRLFAVDDPAACPRCVEVFREATDCFQS